MWNRVMRLPASVGIDFMTRARASLPPSSGLSSMDPLRATEEGAAHEIDSGVAAAAAFIAARGFLTAPAMRLVHSGKIPLLPIGLR